jgi:hypothetical protein
LEIIGASSAFIWKSEDRNLVISLFTILSTN